MSSTPRLLAGTVWSHVSHRSTAAAPALFQRSFHGSSSASTSKLSPLHKTTLARKRRLERNSNSSIGTGNRVKGATTGKEVIPPMSLEEAAKKLQVSENTYSDVKTSSKYKRFLTLEPLRMHSHCRSRLRTQRTRLIFKPNQLRQSNSTLYEVEYSYLTRAHHQPNNP